MRVPHSFDPADVIVGLQRRLDGGLDMTEYRDLAGTPRISIGMPVLNGMRFMRRAVRSLLAQSFTDFELIIVDNASADGSYEYARSLSDPRIRIGRNERNIGAIQNFKKVLAEARGELFMWAAADDFWEPDFVRRLVVELDAHPEAGVVMSATRRLRENGTVKDVVRFLGAENPSEMSPLRLALELGSSRKCNMFVSGLFRRALLQDVARDLPDGGAPERVLLAELALVSKFRYVDEVLYHRQLHDLLHEQRYPDEAYSRSVALGVLGDLQFLWSLAVTLSTSSVVPLRRKLYTPLVVARFAATRAYGRSRSQAIQWRRLIQKKNQARAKTRSLAKQTVSQNSAESAPIPDAPFPRTRTIMAFGRKHRFRCHSAKEERTVRRLLIEEPGTIEWLSAVLRNDDIFFDVGANIGSYAIFAGLQIGEAGLVYCFEPHLPSAMSLLVNIEKNRLQHRVHLISLPLSDQDGFGPFHYHSLAASAAKSQFARNIVDGQPFVAAATELKYGCRLDTLIELGLVRIPTVIKIDVDGLEGRIISGMEKLLGSPRAPRSLQVALQSDTAEEIIARMTDADYDLVSRHWSVAAQNSIGEGLDQLARFPHHAIFTKGA